MNGISKIELELNEFIKTLGYSYERNNRKILKAIAVNSNNYSEIDFWFSKQNVGIEFDGDYYHNNGYYNRGEFVLASHRILFFKKKIKSIRNNQRFVIKFAKSYIAKIFIYHVYEFEWRDKKLREKVKEDIINLLSNNHTKFDLSKNTINIDAGKDNYLYLLKNGYTITQYNEPKVLRERGKLRVFDCGSLIMKKNKKEAKSKKQTDNVLKEEPDKALKEEN